MKKFGIAAGIALLVIAIVACIGFVWYQKMPSAKELVSNEYHRLDTACDKGNKKACAYFAEVERSRPKLTHREGK